MTTQRPSTVAAEGIKHTPEYKPLRPPESLYRWARDGAGETGERRRRFLAQCEAVPEVLEALKALISHPAVLEALAPRESLGSLLAQAEAAIKKAEGRQ